MSSVYIFFFSSRRRHTRLQGDWSSDVCSSDLGGSGPVHARNAWRGADQQRPAVHGDRKSTRLNSSHLVISYAVFCLKKKKNTMTALHSSTQSRCNAAGTLYVVQLALC